MRIILSTFDKKEEKMSIFSVLQKGVSVSNPTTYKKVQQVLTLVGSAGPLIAVFNPTLAQYVTPDNLAALGAFVGGLNIYMTTATTDKIGF